MDGGKEQKRWLGGQRSFGFILLRKETGKGKKFQSAKTGEIHREKRTDAMKLETLKGK